MTTIRVPVGKFCLYDHSANGQVFYVGIGKPTRPFEKTGRNDVWTEFVSRLDEYFVTIHSWADDFDELREMEASMIKTLMPACNQRQNPNWSEPAKRQAPKNEIDPEADSRLIACLGGPAQLARLLGMTKPGSVQRIVNWRRRGIPLAVNVQHAQIFMPALLLGARP